MEVFLNILCSEKETDTTVQNKKIEIKRGKNCGSGVLIILCSPQNKSP